jgi:hypothetical protein
MKREVVFSLSAACLALALFTAQYVHAGTGPESTSADYSAKTAVAHSQAELMVRAQVILKKEIDARKLRTGDSFQATLLNKVQLINGPELPRDTVLKGTVTIDQATSNGSSQLILRFTEAELKDGRILPVKATITGLLRVGYGESGIIFRASDAWNQSFVQISQPNALDGVDLNSAIGDADSGAFTSAKLGKLRLAEGSKLGLALALQGNS